MKLLRLFLAAAVPAVPVACKKNAGDQVGRSEQSGDSFSNRFFGLHVAFPAGWHVQSDEETKLLMDIGNEVISGDNAELKSAMKSARPRTVNLFSVFKFPAGSPVPFNPSIICMAEDVSAFPGIQTGRDYLYHTRQLLKASNAPLQPEEETIAAEIGKRHFDGMNVTGTVGDITLHQRYFVTIDKGYALSFIVSFNSPEDEATLNEVLDSVRFD